MKCLLDGEAYEYYITQGMYLAAFGVAVAGGFAAGYVATGTWRGAVTGAFTAGLTFGVGWAAVANQWGTTATIAAQAVTGGVIESLQGGNFGNGFITAGLTAAVMPHVGTIGNNVARTTVGAIVGGTISEATGGKFANGAISGAIQAAMAGRNAEETMSVEAGQSEISDFSDAPDATTQSQLNNPATRRGVARKMVADMYGERVASNVQFSDVALRQDSYYSPWRSEPNVAADVTKKFFRAPKITIYDRAFDIGSYNALASIIDHEVFHYFVYTTGGNEKMTRSQNEVRAVGYQMTRPAWNLTSPSFKQQMYDYRAACIASPNCGNYGL